jgi:hypothetical protein
MDSGGGNAEDGKEAKAEAQEITMTDAHETHLLEDELPAEFFTDDVRRCLNARFNHRMAAYGVAEGVVEIARDDTGWELDPKSEFYWRRLSIKWRAK